ncbi:unnamed protein product [Acanthoscelides obtectus]|uniref:Uncharacterized protein n=1 Tax=Acanthoscelides obtectus TaxID=200917 RepID=A0A9P0KG25_ACAOB|nr:unnamed protein product [Acanthoscelides obtectus]CAK1649309.1 hypothetical protein AOBTE_LOCUS16146 [Acanthoscelides obtectus]
MSLQGDENTHSVGCSEYILISTEGNSAIQSQWQSQNAEVSYKWTRQNTLLFLDLYKKYKQLLMAGKIKLKNVYESIANASEINQRMRTWLHQTVKIDGRYWKEITKKL